MKAKSGPSPAPRSFCRNALAACVLLSTLAAPLGEAASLSLTKTLPVVQGYVFGVSVHPSNTHQVFFTGALSVHAGLADLCTGKVIWKAPRIGTSGATFPSLAVSPSGRYVATQDATGQVLLISGVDGTLLHAIRPPTEARDIPYGFAFHPNEKSLMFFAWGGGFLYDIETGTLDRVLGDLVVNDVVSAGFLDESHAVALSQQRGVVTWNLARPEKPL
ncbi:MAG: hypothetical protein IOD12_03685, partial [Silvanigrellales bacterium]|nr:hypothetical protein [Silvanigrellales bacterium]